MAQSNLLLAETEEQLRFNYVSYGAKKGEGPYNSSALSLSLGSVSNTQSGFYNLFSGEYGEHSHYINNRKYLGDFLMGTIAMGGRIQLLGESFIAPFIELGPEFGVGYLFLRSPPVGENNSSFGFVYGGQGNFGVRLGKPSGFKLNLNIGYRLLWASKLAGASGYDLSALLLGVSIGI